MKQSTFLALFITANISFIFLQVHKHSKRIKLSYTKQIIENQKISLIKQKQELTHNLYTLNDRASIKQYIKENKDTLALVPVRINQIKKVPDDAHT